MGSLAMEQSHGGGTNLDRFAEKNITSASQRTPLETVVFIKFQTIAPQIRSFLLLLFVPFNIESRNPNGGEQDRPRDRGVSK